MTIEIHGDPASISTKRVAVVFEENKIPYKLIPVRLAKHEQKAPEHVANQPFGQVPFINDNGFILYESRAISRYVALKYAWQGSPLIPADPADLEAIAKFEEAASIEYANFERFVFPILNERVFKKFYNKESDETVVADSLAKLEGKLDVYERILSKQKYLAGDALSIVDLFHLPNGTLLGVVGVDVLKDEKRPNVARWWKDIFERPAWEKVVNGVPEKA